MRINIDENASNSIINIPMLEVVDCLLRISVIPVSVAAIWLTVTNQQDNSDYGKLKFSNFMGLKKEIHPPFFFGQIFCFHVFCVARTISRNIFHRYTVCISAICAGYALVAAISSWIRFLVTKTWIFFLSDQIVAYLMVTSGAAALEILYLAYNGDQQVTWSEACSIYGKFCDRMKIAFVLHALALGGFIILAVISAFRFFSMFDPPFVSRNKEVEEERT